MLKIIFPLVVIAFLAFYFWNASTVKKVSSENIEKGKKYLAANSQVEGVQITNSGLQYQVLTEGNGTQHPTASDHVKVHYHGTMIDGTVFDSSVERGQPITFALNQVITGWTEGLQLMVVGQKNRLFIPSELGYGNRGVGTIAPGSVLIFDVELLGINE